MTYGSITGLIRSAEAMKKKQSEYILELEVGLVQAWDSIQSMDVEAMKDWTKQWRETVDRIKETRETGDAL